MERRAHSTFPETVEFSFRHDLVREAAHASLTGDDLVLGHRLAGDVYRALGRYPESLKHFSSAFEVAPTSQHVLRLFGTRMEAGDEGGAATLLEDWLAKNPEDSAAHLALAQNHLGRGQLDQARVRYQKVLELNPFDAAALNNLAYVLDKQDSAEALEYAQRAVRLSPDDPAILDTLGWMLVRRGRTDQGLKYLRDAHSRAAGNPQIRYHIASALVALNRAEEAKVELRRALQISDEFEGVDEARRMLATVVLPANPTAEELVPEVLIKLNLPVLLFATGIGPCFPGFLCLPSASGIYGSIPTSGVCGTNQSFDLLITPGFDFTPIFSGVSGFGPGGGLFVSPALFSPGAGITVAVQAAIIDPRALPLGVIVTNAIEFTF